MIAIGIIIIVLLLCIANILASIEKAIKDIQK
jgi:hypothetical protein